MVLFKHPSPPVSRLDVACLLGFGTLIIPKTLKPDISCNQESGLG